MADNTRLFAGTGGDLIKTEDIGGTYKLPVSEIYVGSHGIDGGPVSSGNPLPVAVEGPVSIEGEVSIPTTVTVDGTVSVVGIVPVQGSVAALLTTGALTDGTIQLTPRHMPLSVSTVGVTTIVPPVAGKRIRILQYLVIASAPVSIEFRSGSTPLTGAMPLQANGGIGVSSSVLGHFTTAVGEGLVINLSAPVAVAGHLTYIEV